MPVLSLTKCLGAIETVHPTAIPEGYVAEALNVELNDTALVRPRAGTIRVPLTNWPTNGAAYYLFADRLNDRLWGFANDGNAHLWDGVAWTPVALPNHSLSTQAHCAAYNGKVYIAYDSTVNRLHVYDGGTVRRVGVLAPAAPTVANTGSGAYAATVRSYKVRMFVMSGARTVASSELSPSVSFTPSGSGAAARVTRPAAVDAATHWQVYGISTDGLNYYALGGKIAVATTTYDDAAPTSTYPAGEIAPEPGLFVPPPSARFLATNGERLFMAGSYEASAGAGETAPSARRVWFTRPLGATDAGDDEAITQAADNRYYLDIDNDDGGAITGLASTIDGAIYAFTATSVWRLSDTGSSDQPVRAERVVAGSGASGQQLITSTDTEQASAMYFMAHDGPYRYTPQEGAAWLGADWVHAGFVSQRDTQSPSAFTCCHFDPVSRVVLWSGPTRFRCRAFSPRFSSLTQGRVRGGWTTLEFAYMEIFDGLARVLSMAVFRGRLYMGGNEASGAQRTPLLFVSDDTTVLDSGSTMPLPRVTTGDIVFDPIRNVSTQDAYLWKPVAMEAAIELTSSYGPAKRVLVSEASPATTPGPTFGAYHRAKVEGSDVSDTATLRVSVTVTTPVMQSTNSTDAISRVDVPYKAQDIA